MKPGEYFLQSDPIIANAGRATARVVVRHTGDRPIQVGSHYHFFEVNNALNFDREQALRHAPGYRRRHGRALRAGRGERGRRWWISAAARASSAIKAR